MNESLRSSTLTVRILLLVVIAASLPILQGQTAEARICGNGEIADTCQAQQCREDLDGCYPEPPVTPPGSCGDSYLVLHPPLAIRGSVFGPGGVGVSEACVYWFMRWANGSTSHGSVATDDSGLFTIDIAADAGTITLYASKTYMTWDSEVVTATAYALDPSKRAEMEISYTQSVAVAPVAFNSSAPRSVTVTVISAAPATSSRVLAEVNPGTILTLSRDLSYTGFAPLSRWTATTNVPSGLSEGVKTVPTCILSIGGSGTCDSPGLDIVYSGVPPGGFRGFFAIDNTPPTLGNATPKNLHNTTDSTPLILASPSDALSGPDLARGSLLLNGSPLSSSLSATPSSPLPTGTYSVTATIWDVAGNSAEVGWRFAVTVLKGGEATATVTPKTVNIAPPPPALPPLCCAYVYFGEVDSELTAYDLELEGSPMWAGIGTTHRQIQHSNLRVTFKSPAQEITVPIPHYSSSFRSDIAVLEPSSERLGVNVAASRSKIYGVGATVPPDFVITQDSTATVWAAVETVAETSLEVPHYENNDPIPYVMPECQTWSCSVTGIITCTISASYSCNGTYPRVTLEREKPGGLDIPRAVLGKFGQVNEGDPRLQDSAVREDYPVPNPAKSQWVGGVETFPNCANGFACKNLLDASDSKARLTAFWATGGLFRAYGHEYFFKVSQTADPTSLTDVLSWQTSDVTPGSACGPSGTPCWQALLTDFGNSIESLDSNWQLLETASTEGSTLTAFPGATQTVGPLSRPLDVNDASRGPAYRLGAKDDPTRLVNLVVPPAPDQPELEGWFETDSKILSSGGERQSGIGAFNLWHPQKDDRTNPAVDYRARPAEVFSGARFGPISSTGSFGLRARVFFKFRIVELS